MNSPGISNTPFYITMSEDWFDKGDILKMNDTVECTVIKAYKRTWWRKVLQYFGFNVRICQLKVINKTNG